MKRIRVCVGVLVAGLVLAGCGGGETPGRATIGPSSAPNSGGVDHGRALATSATTPEPSTTTTAPDSAVVVPPEARAHTSEGAKAFAGFYLHQYSLAALRGESALMAGLAQPQCEGCSALLGVVRKLQRDGQHVDIEAMRVKLVQESAGTMGNSVTVDVLAEELQKRIIAKDGATVAIVRGAKFDFRFLVVWQSQGWTISDLRVVR